MATVTCKSRLLLGLMPDIFMIPRLWASHRLRLYTSNQDVQKILTLPASRMAGDYLGMINNELSSETTAGGFTCIRDDDWHLR